MSDSSFIEESATPAEKIIENGEGGEEIEAAPVIPEKKRINSVKIKYNGKDFEEKLPFEIDEDPAVIEYMTKQLQLAKMSQVKAQEAKTLEQDIVSFLQELKTNPKKALSNPLVGLDVKQFAAQILEEELENAKKSPEQIEKEKLAEELKALKEEREREKQEAEQRAYQQTLERSYEKYENMLTNSLDQNPDLPREPYVIEKMTKYMSMAVEAGYEPDMSVISGIVRDEINSDMQKVLNSLSEKDLEKFLGKNVLEKLRKSRLASAKKAPPTVKSIAKDVATKKPSEKPSNSPKTTIRDFFGV